ncbi:hypothetical protein VII00023_07819 [Vibrio ichthyoenteri ATCC 700023]|uniref:Uncharacterized protein n=1 Tax=Vibrio ichthyoenteri ATCC 700023 TaxID=870968 RepID=F9S759_9VIBR|nr:hypothetical protein VII00023_07819 [Vibrio ichthyoenteri ATCC 700023]
MPFFYLLKLTFKIKKEPQKRLFFLQTVSKKAWNSRGKRRFLFVLGKKYYRMG